MLNEAIYIGCTPGIGVNPIPLLKQTGIARFYGRDFKILLPITQTKKWFVCILKIL